LPPAALAVRLRVLRELPGAAMVAVATMAGVPSA
jgi:hypothetical protein